MKKSDSSEEVLSQCLFLKCKRASHNISVRAAHYPSRRNQIFVRACSVSSNRSWWSYENPKSGSEEQGEPENAKSRLVSEDLVPWLRPYVKRRRTSLQSTNLPACSCAGRGGSECWFRPLSTANPINISTNWAMPGLWNNSKRVRAEQIRQPYEVEKSRPIMHISYSNTVKPASPTMELRKTLKVNGSLVSLRPLSFLQVLHFEYLARHCTFFLGLSSCRAFCSVKVNQRHWQPRPAISKRGIRPPLTSSRKRISNLLTSHVSVQVPSPLTGTLGFSETT